MNLIRTLARKLGLTEDLLNAKAKEYLGVPSIEQLVGPLTCEQVICQGNALHRKYQRTGQ